MDGSQTRDSSNFVVRDVKLLYVTTLKTQVLHDSRRSRAQWYSVPVIQAARVVRGTGTCEAREGQRRGLLEAATLCIVPHTSAGQEDMCEHLQT